MYRQPVGTPMGPCWLALGSLGEPPVSLSSAAILAASVMMVLTALAVETPSGAESCLSLRQVGISTMLKMSNISANPPHSVNST